MPSLTRFGKAGSIVFLALFLVVTLPPQTMMRPHSHSLDRTYTAAGLAPLQHPDTDVTGTWADDAATPPQRP